MRTPIRYASRTVFHFALGSLALAAMLSACGGGGDEPEAVAEAHPSFQLAPVLPGEPSDIDADGSSASAALEPVRSRLLAAPGAPGEDGDSLRQRIQSARGSEARDAQAAAAAAPAAVSYTPAQVRSAYGLDQLPPSSSANKGAYQGSGQTIAIIGAYNNAAVATDLATFNAKFGLAPCAVTAIAATAALPLARPAAGSACSFSVVNAGANGTPTSKQPAANAGWATETSMDVQWAHAVAPLARIILVQAASASVTDLNGAITLAGKLGATVVSMSFGAAEFSSQASYDGVFAGSGVSYLAASGDSGRGVSWPAVSTRVLAVGGTTLAASGGARTETAWAGSGGGISAYIALPAWQAALKVKDTSGRIGAPARRVLPDVAFNANPSSGQLIVSAGKWYVAGGTSIGAPQWAGLVAVANAVRALAGKAALGNLGLPVYKALAGTAANYSASTLDVTSGSNGSCQGCAALAGYDLVTGLGTPNTVKTVDLLAAY
jgi:subtilase family serine protease